ncbi:MAG TPA: hypothetical protein VFL92_13325 [Sphingomonas sp.]|nr:hypothetical protein [Sphingomonas sp.]
MKLNKLSAAAAMVATCVSGMAMAAGPVRASNSIAVSHPVSARLGTLGTSARAGVRHDENSKLVGGGLIIAVLAAGAVIAGIVAATSGHHDNGQSN